MKFKFKADIKDIKYFVLFAIFLLYIVAVGVLNLSTLAQDSEFYGWNPIRAFSPDLIVATFVFYILAIIGIIIACSSYFWDRDKGFGFGVGKTEKDGYSRWAKEDEIKKKLKEIDIGGETIPAAGIPLFANKQKVWVDDGEAHTLIIGSTGSGKTRRFITPMIKILAKKGESMILTDPKGELYEQNVGLLTAKGYNIVIINLRSPEKGNAWNPLMLPYQLYKKGSDKALELLSDLAINLLHDEKASDPFWTTTSADYFTGLALGLFEDAKEEEINLNSISFMSSVGEEKFGGSNFVKEYFSSKDPAKPIYINASGTINAPQDTKNSILSVFRQKIKIFATTEQLSEMLSYSDFDMKDIGRKKTAVFIIIQDEKKTYHALATIFLKQCYETLIDVAQDNGGKLPTRTNFILDEFANMPPLKDVTTMITAARSRQIRFNMVVQNFAQLNQVYGKEDAETIKGNCANMVYLMSKEIQALEEISKLCGDKKVKEKDGKEVAKPLINIGELQRLKMGDTIIIKDRSYPLKTKLPDMSEYNFNEPKTTEISYPLREKRAISLFDVREFVKAQKMGSLQNTSMPGGYNPNFMPGGMGSPFGPTGPGQFPTPPRPFMPNINDPIMPGNNPGFMGGRSGLPSMPAADESFNVDDLIKKIDAKIAELEAEEKLENEKANKVIDVKPDNLKDDFEKPIKSPNIPDIGDEIPIEIPKISNIINKVDEEQEELPTEKIVNITPDIDKVINPSNEELNTDDQFFDDFFSDDDDE